MSNGPIVIKVVALIVLLVATVVGCHAHFNNEFKKTWDDMPGFADECKELSECPSEAIPMERTFVALTIICLILSTFSLDAGYHGLAGVLLLISGILMIVAAIKIDDAIMDATGLGGLSWKLSSATSMLLSTLKSPPTGKDIVSDVKDEIRKELKFYNKLAGGGLAIIDGILYFVAAGIIARSG
ncbi:hypothetical protein Fcan01_27762 [Folsomia candida]|uniref:Uncharacterized protein n=1 Tax=Folsomia candida TaxID=158441 RepID=A0A226CVW3_FOLCA|nr:hypothetical protein Fcan01_27762 [Folsomia candida]